MIIEQGGLTLRFQPLPLAAWGLLPAPQTPFHPSEGYAVETKNALVVLHMVYIFILVFSSDFVTGSVKLQCPMVNADTMHASFFPPFSFSLIPTRIINMV